MGQDLFVVIILLLALASYALNKIPMVVTAFLSMLIMYFSGVLSFGEAFSGFSNNVTMMVLGIGILGIPLTENGIMDIVSNALNKVFNGNSKFGEKGYLVVGGLLVAAISTVLNPTLLVLLFFEITDSLAATPGSAIRRKNCYLPFVAASHAGCSLTSISSTTIILTSGFIEEAVGRPLNFFEPAIIGLPSLLAYLLFFGTIGYRMELKFFDFEENAAAANNSAAGGTEKPPVPKWKFWTTITIFLICIVMFIFSDFQMGAVCMGGAAAMMLTGCVKAKDAFSKARWETVVMVASCLGFAKGVEISGAGQLIASTVASLFGERINNTFVVVIIALVVANLVSQVMNNSSAAAIVTPIMIIMARQAGVDILPVALAAGVGCNLVSATPVCAPMYTAASAVGYRFRDYLIVGGGLNLLAVLFSAVSVFLFYIM